MELLWSKVNIQAQIQHVVTVTFIGFSSYNVNKVSFCTLQFIPRYRYIPLGLNIRLVNGKQRKDNSNQ